MAPNKKVTPPKDVRDFIEMLGDHDVVRQSEAGRRLMEYGKGPLLDALKHNNPDIRAEGTHFLGLLGDRSVEDDLIKLANDPDSHVRMWAAFSLGRIGAEKSLPTLDTLSHDSENIVRLEAEEAIEKVKYRLK